MASYICTLPPPRVPEPPPRSPYVRHTVLEELLITTTTMTSSTRGRVPETTNTSTTATSTTTTTKSRAAAFWDTTQPPPTPSPPSKLIRCADVVWPHVEVQLMVAGVPWALLTGIALLITTSAPVQARNARKLFRKYEYGLSSAGYGSAAAVMTVHSIQCIIFGVRAQTGSVNPIWYALETLGALLLLPDVLSTWMYTITGGTEAVLISAFTGPLALDVLVLTSVVALAVGGPGVGLTWFSFSYLAAFRLMSILRAIQREQASVGDTGWQRHIAYHVSIVGLFIFGSGCTIMLFENLEKPATRAHGEEPVWDFLPAVIFALTTLETNGGGTLAPQTVLGRIFACGLIVWTLWHLCFNVFPLLRKILLEKNMGQSRYRPSDVNKVGHLVVLGTPTAAMMWDFVLELYHPNHFESPAAFVEEAPWTVIMLPNEKTLRHLTRFLGRREGLAFRDRVVLLCGDAFRHEDLIRCAIHSAKRAVVLPDLGAADVSTDDSSNIMRTFQLYYVAPDVFTTCLLHRPDHSLETLSAGRSGRLSFLSVDAFKLTLLATACITRGSLTLICNLCRTVGDTESFGMAWQADYERGLGCELYELTLSEAYDHLPFGEVAMDVHHRSQGGTVYLIGVTETGLAPGDSRRIVLHPGNKYEVCVKDFAVAGVFIAPDLSAIQQCALSEARELYGGKAKQRKPVSPTKHAQSQGDRKRSASESWETEEFEEVELQLPNMPDRRVSAQGSVASRASIRKPEAITQLTAEERDEAFAIQHYEAEMTQIKRRLMVRGLKADLIALVTGMVDPWARKREAEHNLRVQGAARSKSAPATQREGRRAAALGDYREKVLEQQIRRELGQIGQHAIVTYEELRRLHARHDHMEMMVKYRQEPPPNVILVGGHLLLCVVSDTLASMTGSETDWQMGPSLGLSHFLAPLRDDAIVGKGDNRPVVMVLAEQVPGDWHDIADDERSYFVRGSPLKVADLERAGFRQARAIVIVRCHNGRGAGRVTDSRMILAANMIQNHLPSDSHIPVITDHAYLGTCEFLPLGSYNMVEVLGGVEAAPAPPPPVDLPWLSGDWGSHSDWDELGARVPPSDEDYEQLESCDYSRHPRFMRGDMFVSSSVISLVANTMYNPSVVSLVEALTAASMVMIPLPVEWERRSYSEFSTWLLRNRNMIALGIYRSSGAVKSTADGERVATLGPPLYYMYTAPPGSDTYMIRSDRILCLAPHGTREAPPPMPAAAEPAQR